MRAEVGDFPFHPGIGVLAFQMGPHCSDEVAHGPHTTSRNLKGETKLVCRCHILECTVAESS